jgi:TPR repeat protein
MYAAGTGVPKDKTQALFWFHKAAERGGVTKTMATNSMERLESEGAPPLPPR